MYEVRNRHGYVVAIGEDKDNLEFIAAARTALHEIVRAADRS